MLKSTSPSDFWGRRWNLLVHRGLKNGVYKPTRSCSSSRMAAVLATFVASGIIHEYVDYAMFAGTSHQFQWKQMLFFGWNGILIMVEYGTRHWQIWGRMSKNLPQTVITAMVLSSALPIAHLFFADWIKYGFFDAVYLTQPVIVCGDA